MLLIEAVRRNRKTADATDEDIKEEIVNWLHGAGDRRGGRTERHKKKTDQQQSVSVDS